jgi:integrase
MRHSAPTDVADVAAIGDVAPMTVAAYAVTWSAMQMVRPTTKERFDYVLWRRIVPRFGDRPLCNLQRSEVQAWVSELLDEGLSASTVRSFTAALSTMLLNARRDGLMTTNPCEMLRLPRIDDAASIVKPLSVAEVHSIAATVDRRYRALILTMAHQGLRMGEACGLTRDRIDLEQRIMVIDRQLITPSNGSPRFGPPKTRSSHRRLPMSDTTCRVLRDHLDEFALGPHGLIFTSSRGRPLGRTTFGQLVRIAVNKLGLEATSHDLRHHCASLLIAEGCPVTTVQHFLGHKNATETLNTYAHLWNHDDDRIRAAVDRQFAYMLTG